MCFLSFASTPSCAIWSAVLVALIQPLFFSRLSTTLTLPGELLRRLGEFDARVRTALLARKDEIRSCMREEIDLSGKTLHIAWYCSEASAAGPLENALFIAEKGG
jgi:hypothetical protein